MKRHVSILLVRAREGKDFGSKERPDSGQRKEIEVMIDIHTHLGAAFDQKAAEYWQKNHRIPDWVSEAYVQAMESVDKAIILGFSVPPGNITSNECVAHFIREHDDKFIPFYCVDPALPTATSDLDHAVQEWGAKGIKLGPIYQTFRPDDEQYFPVYERIEELELPIMWHQGSSFAAPEGPLEWAQPWMLDKISRTFPNLKMVIAHFGFPWIREVVALLRKRPNVYTDVSAFGTRTWGLYNALVDAVQYGAEDKVFFGSDFPMFTPAQMRDALYGASSIPEGTNLPPLPRDVIERILNRNCLEILGIK
jgi:predicted TIM-barrel fold metal-dependent hydrolase